MTRTGTTLAIIGGVALTAGIAVGGYQLNWWVAKDSAERESKIREELPGTQTSRRDEAIQSVEDFHITTDPTAQAILRRKACRLLATVDGDYMTPVLIEFNQGEC